MVPRKPTPDGKRIPLAVKVSETKAAQIDEARGDMTRAAWLAAAIDVYLAERITAEILAEPGALTEIAVAGAEIAAGDVVSGVEAVRALRPRRKPETPPRIPTVRPESDYEMDLAEAAVFAETEQDRPRRRSYSPNKASECPHPPINRIGPMCTKCGQQWR